MPFDPQAKLAAKKISDSMTALSPKIKGDPLDVRKGESTEADDKAELIAFREELRKADKAVEDVSGCEFYTTLVFLTKDQRDAFISHFSSMVIAEGGRYIDGITAARSMGVNIPDARPTAIRPSKPDRAALAVGLIQDYPT